MSKTGRSITSRVLLALGALLVGASLLLSYAAQNLLEQDAFADHLTSALLSEPTVDYLAEQVTDIVIAGQPNLLLARPLVASITKSVLQSSLVEQLVRSSASQLHATMFDESGDSVIITVADVITLVKARVAAASPELAEQIPQELSDASITLVNSELRLETLRVADNLKTLAVALPLLALVLFALALAVATDKRDALLGLTVAVAFVAIVLLAAEEVLRQLLVESLATPEARDIGGAIWSEFLGDFSSWVWTLLGVSLLAAALVSSLLSSYDVMQLVKKLGQAVLKAPETLTGSVARPVGAILVGLVLIFEPEAFLRFATILIGATLIVEGTSKLLAKTPLPAYLEKSAQRQSQLERPTVRRAAMWLGIGLVGVIVAGAVSASMVVSNRAAAAETTGCNGFDSLCERKLNEVVFAATHNSMSAATEGFIPPNHAKNITSQLRQGYRALLIDTWYGFDQGSYVYTGDDVNGPAPEDKAEQLGEEAVAAAERLRSKAPSREDQQIYLCHELCEVGAIPFEPALVELRVWLKQNPREVLILFIQDQISPEDTEGAFERAGLVDNIRQLDLDSPMPTLIELIESDQRLIVMAENNSEGVDWYLDGFSFVQETPFGFTSLEEFSCEANRGSFQSPFFLVNHFFQLPLNSNNFINDREVLLPRLEQCQDERGLLPNLVGVDFGESGDVIELVNELNGVG